MQRESAPKTRWRPTKKFGIFVLLGIALLIIIVIAIRAGSNRATSPDFPAVLPMGKSIGDLGGWQRFNPPNSDPVFTYSDTIGKVPISVTEQALPKSLQPDLATKVAELAKGYNANTVVEAADVKVYIGTSNKGPQSVIFVRHNVLVMIKSQSKIPNANWEHYATSLISTESSLLPKF